MEDRIMDVPRPLNEMAKKKKNLSEMNTNSSAAIKNLAKNNAPTDLTSITIRPYTDVREA